MKHLILIVLLSLPISANGPANHLFVCRSPLLAFDFWRALQNLQQQGVTLTPKITQEICAGMRAGREPQCIRIEGDDFKPIASGWSGALAMTDGKTKIWFHNPDTGGWIHPDYYVSYVNRKR
jgi:hypothetical protein